ncbi:MAG: TIR domain-containing protein [Vitreimonas sp.]
MAEQPFEYWRPGSEERRLRLFISHRFGKDETLYDDVVKALNSNGHAVQDISLSASMAMAGPRGGDLPELSIQAEIAARIYTSDVLVAPSRVGAGQSEWVSWEVQIAAICYGIPILFVDHEHQKNRARLVSEIEALSLPHKVSEPRAPEIVRGIIELLSGRLTWGMRQEETESTVRFRGPPAAARSNVLKNFPFQARLTPLDPSSPTTPKKGPWPFGGDRAS